MRRTFIQCATVLIAFLLATAGLPQRCWAQYKVVHLERPYNTTGSETGALMVGDTVLVYSSMPHATGGNRLFQFNTAVMQLMQARVARNGKVARPKPCRWGLNSPRDHTGNLAIDPLTHDLYFTRCRPDDPNLNCEIYFARRLKRGWDKPQRLKGPVNGKGYTSTHPSVGRLPDGSAILYFASNRPEGMGGMDLWYSIVKDGVAEQPVNLGPRINSPHDEVTPYYDQPNGVLYLASDRPGGLGGFDIYCAVGSRNTWQPAEPACGCLNSEYNDLYFTITRRDSATGAPIGGYLASNRPDSYFLTDSTCCNDLYLWGIDSIYNQEMQRRYEDSLATLAAQTAVAATTDRPPLHFLFPLFLYFHNDEPDPQSRDSLTTTPYSTCQQHYASLRNEYLAHQTTADDSAMMQQFFDTCVVGNYERVGQLFDYIEAMLDEGHAVTLTIAGYASPLYRDDYNLRLSRRRIESFLLLVAHWRNGIFAQALDDGRLAISQQPHGAVEPTTRSRSTDPVYGLPAALARRIEILSCIAR